MLLLLSRPLSAQEITIQGQVKDTENNPILYASVYATTTDSANVLGYTTTVVDGIFKLTLKHTKEFLLTVRYLGYKEKIILVPNPDLVAFFEITLEPELTYLEDVVIEGEELRYLKKNDSTIFDVKQYTDGFEENLADVLKKLPGFDVREDGSIYYHNKRIDNVYLDGIDVLGNNYTLATRKLKSDFIEKVTVIENHLDNPLLKGIKDGEKTILDLTMPEDRKGTVLGDIEISAGLQKELFAYLNVFTIMEKVKTFSFGGYNNTGNYNHAAGYSIPDNELAFSEHADLITYNQLSGSSPIKMYFNNEAQFSVNLGYLVSEKIKLRSDISFYDNKLNLSGYSGSLYRLSDSSGFSFTENYIKYSQINKIKYTANAQINLNSKNRLAINIAGQLPRSMEEAVVRIRQANDEIFVKELLNNNFNQLLTQLNYTNRISGSMALLWENEFWYSDKPQLFHVNYSLRKLPVVNNAYDSLVAAQQNVVNNWKSAKSKLKLLGKLGRIANFEYIVFTHLLKQDLQTQFTSIPLDNQLADFRNNNLLINNRYGYRIKITKNIRDIHLQIKAGQNWVSISDKRGNISGVENSFFVGNVKVTYKYSTRGEISLAAGHNTQYQNIDMYYERPVLSDYRTFYSGDTNTIPSGRINAVLLFNYNNLFRQVSFNALVTAFKETNPRANSIEFYNTLVFLRNTPLSYQRGIYSRYNFSKLWAYINLNTKISLAYAYRNYPSLIFENSQNTERRNSSNNLNLNITVQTFFDLPLNIKANFGYNYSDAIVEGNIGSFASVSKTLSGNLYHKNKYLKVDLGILYYTVLNSAATIVSFRGSGTLIEKRLKWTCRIYNLLNQQHLGAQQITFYSDSFSETRILPRQILLGLIWSF